MNVWPLFTLGDGCVRSTLIVKCRLPCVPKGTASLSNFIEVNEGKDIPDSCLSERTCPYFGEAYRGRALQSTMRTVFLVVEGKVAAQRHGSTKVLEPDTQSRVRADGPCALSLPQSAWHIVPQVPYITMSLRVRLEYRESTKRLLAGAPATLLLHSAHESVGVPIRSLKTLRFAWLDSMRWRLERRKPGAAFS